MVAENVLQLLLLLVGFVALAERRQIFVMPLSCCQFRHPEDNYWAHHRIPCVRPEIIVATAVLPLNAEHR